MKTALSLAANLFIALAAIAFFATIVTTVFVARGLDAGAWGLLALPLPIGVMTFLAMGIAAMELHDLAEDAR